MNKLLATTIAFATLVSSSFANKDLNFFRNQTGSNVNQSVATIDLTSDLVNYTLLTTYGITAENIRVTVAPDNEIFLNINPESVTISRGMLNNVKTQLKAQILTELQQKLNPQITDIPDIYLSTQVKDKIKIHQDEINSKESKIKIDLNKKISEVILLEIYKISVGNRDIRILDTEKYIFLTYEYV